LIDSVKVSCPTQHKIAHFGNIPQANILAWYGKTKPKSTKARIHQSREELQHKINFKKLKQGLLASYDIRPGNGEAILVLALYKSVTYLLT